LLSYLYDDYRKQAILISENHDDSNWCTPYKGNPNQHTTCIPRSVRVWSQTIRISRSQCISIFREVVNSDGQSHCSWENGSRYNPQHDGWPIRRSVPNFSPELVIKAVRVKPPFIDFKLLGLLGLYHQHVIGMFNTYSRGPIHWSLADTGGGYSLEGTEFPHTITRPFQLTISPFHIPTSLNPIQIVSNLDQPKNGLPELKSLK
jgi:hypothetical protein